MGKRRLDWEELEVPINPSGEGAALGFPERGLAGALGAASVELFQEAFNWVSSARLGRSLLLARAVARGLGPRSHCHVHDLPVPASIPTEGTRSCHAARGALPSLVVASLLWAMALLTLFT